MHPHKLIIKLFAAPESLKAVDFVSLFHQWIQQKSLADHLLIDVADYAHVPDGPGTLLVSSEANIHMDDIGGRLGLMYVRKRPMAGATCFADELRGTLAQTFAVAAKLEQDPAVAGRLKFRTEQITVRFNDRLLTPNTPDTIVEYHPLVATVAAKLFPGRPVKVAPCNTSPEQLLELRVTADELPSATLLERASHA